MSWYMNIELNFWYFACFSGSNITAGSGSIFMSETDLSSEAEDTLFMNGKTQNGRTQNGGINLHKTQDDFVKTNNLKNKFSKA